MTSHVPDFSDPIPSYSVKILSASIIRNKVLLGIFSWAEISLMLIRLFYALDSQSHLHEIFYRCHRLPLSVLNSDLLVPLVPFSAVFTMT